MEKTVLNETRTRWSVTRTLYTAVLHSCYILSIATAIAYKSTGEYGRLLRGAMNVRTVKFREVRSYTIGNLLELINFSPVHHIAY